MAHTTKVAHFLLNRYQLPHRTFGLTDADIDTPQWHFRRLVANLLVAGSADERAVAAAEHIFQKWSTMQQLTTASKSDLRAAIQKHDIRFDADKADRIRSAAARTMSEFRGRVPCTRELLQSYDGVGRHTSSVMLALAFHQPAFAVDLHVKRVSARLGLLPANASAMQVEQFYCAAVDSDVWGHLSRSFVEFGKDICAFTPQCASCPFAAECAHAQQSGNKHQKSTMLMVDGTYNVTGTDYHLTVRNGYVQCTCKGFRFRHKCHHVDDFMASVVNRQHRISSQFVLTNIVTHQIRTTV